MQIDFTATSSDSWSNEIWVEETLHLFTSCRYSNKYHKLLCVHRQRTKSKHNQTAKNNGQTNTSHKNGTAYRWYHHKSSSITITRVDGPTLSLLIYRDFPLLQKARASLHFPMTLLTDVVAAYLAPLLKKHSVGEPLVWEDLEASRVASLEVLKKSDNSFVSVR